MNFRVRFDDVFFDCEDVEQAYDALLEYLSQVVKYEDVTAFTFDREDVEEPSNDN